MLISCGCHPTLVFTSPAHICVPRRDDADRDELSLDGQQKAERRGEDLKVGAFAPRTQERAPRVQDSIVQYRH